MGVLAADPRIVPLNEDKRGIVRERAAPQHNTAVRSVNDLLPQRKKRRELGFEQPTTTNKTDDDSHFFRAPLFT